MAEWSWKQGDTKEAIQVTLKDGNGAAVDLTNADTVKFWMWDALTHALAISGGAMTIVGLATAGVAKYTPTGNYAVGEYDAEVRVTWLDGSVETFPNDDDDPYIRVFVVAKIA